MAMDGDAMAAMVTDAITDAGATEASKAMVLANMKKLCGAIVDYIHANAELAGKTTGTSDLVTGKVL